jgi:hypothetical protein
MKPIDTIRVAACAAVAACALGACTQPDTYGTHRAPPAPPDGRGASPTATMPDANTRYETRPSPGNTMPPPRPNGVQGDDRPLPGTPPPMQY